MDFCQVKKAKEILTKSSKQLCIMAAKQASISEVFLKELIELSLGNEQPYSWRAGWSLVYLSQIEPSIVIPHLRLIANTLSSLQHHSQVGSFLRLFDTLQYDFDDFGDVLDYCFHVIRMPQKREYVKVIALQILLRFGKAFPELIPEIIEQIELSKPNFEMGHCKKKAVQVLSLLRKME